MTPVGAASDSMCFIVIRLLYCTLYYCFSNLHAFGVSGCYGISLLIMRIVFCSRFIAIKCRIILPVGNSFLSFLHVAACGSFMEKSAFPPLAFAIDGWDCHTMVSPFVVEECVIYHGFLWRCFPCFFKLTGLSFISLQMVVWSVSYDDGLSDRRHNRSLQKHNPSPKMVRTRHPG